MNMNKALKEFFLTENIKNEKSILFNDANNNSLLFTIPANLMKNK